MEYKSFEKNNLNWPKKDIPLMEYKGHLVTELSLFNDAKSLQNISVDHAFGQKIISIKINERLENESSDWYCL